jgi:hypothetical protein
MTSSQYFGLVGMVLAEFAWCTTFTALSLWNGVSGGLQSWTSWANVHSDFSRIDRISMENLSQQRFCTILALWWTMPGASIIFFIFSALTGEILSEYRRLWRHIFPRQRVKPNPLSTLSISKYVRPLFTSLSLAYIPALFVHRSPILISTIKLPGFSNDESKSPSYATLPHTLAKEAPSLTTSNHDHITPSHKKHSSEDTFHCISLSDAYCSRPPSPSFDVSHDLVMGHPPGIPLAAYNQPVAPPIVYRDTEPRPAFGGILVTIHKHAHVDPIS